MERLTGREGIDSLISIDKIQTIIKFFKNNSPGESKINKTILTKLPNIALIQLQWIFNHTLSMGYFPNKFKTAIIKLLPKPNTDHTEPSNYRPISLLEVPRKILEKIINKRLRHFLENNNKLPNT